VQGLRSLADVDIDLDGLGVLIGENGSGKSSVIEALEILRRTTTTGFWDDLYAIHGGPARLMRDGETELALEVEVSGALVYRIVFVRAGAALQARDERLEDSAGNIVFDFKLDTAAAAHGGPEALQPPALRHRVRGEDARVTRARAALESIQTHVGFEVLAAWAAAVAQRRSAMRESQLIRPATKLELLGTNLASAYSALKNDFGRAHWDETLDLVRLGLGVAVESVDVAVDPAGGQGAIKLRLRGQDNPIRAAALSDGTLAYLAMVALIRLGATSTVVAIDEPDLHLHPGMVVRVAQLLERLGGKTSVLVATHSDRFLDTLRDPARAVRVLELGADGTTAVRRLDSATLAEWLRDYSGLGELRADGNLRSVVADEITPDAEGSPDHPL
jgi:predicted ATPase